MTMNLKNGVTKTKEYLIIKDEITGWYISNRTFGDGGLRYLTFTPHKENADTFSDNPVNKDTIDVILSSPFDLKVIKVTKTLIEFDNEEVIG